MPVQNSFPVTYGTDFNLVFNLTPAVAIGGWAIQFTAWRHFNGTSGVVQKYANSGYSNVSGITVTNSGQGIVTVNFRQIGVIDASGVGYSNLAYQLYRPTSGNWTVLAEGWLSVQP